MSAASLDEGSGEGSAAEWEGTTDASRLSAVETAGALEEDCALEEDWVHIDRSLSSRLKCQSSHPYSLNSLTTSHLSSTCPHRAEIPPICPCSNYMSNRSPSSNSSPVRRFHQETLSSHHHHTLIGLWRSTRWYRPRRYRLLHYLCYQSSTLAWRRGQGCELRASKKSSRFLPWP